MTQIERICRILESQGLDIDNEQVLCTIEAKMPQWMLREVYAIREMFPDRYNVKALRNIIRAKLRISEASEFMSGTLDSHPPKPKEAEEPSHEATFFATSSDTEGDHDKPKCYLCHEKHWVTDCFAFPDPESRKAQAIKLGLCLKCLGKGHRRAQCQKTKPCFYCKGDDHHGALCEGTDDSEPQSRILIGHEPHDSELYRPSKSAMLATAAAKSAGEQVVPTCLTCAAHRSPPQKWVMSVEAHRSIPYEDEDVYLLTRRAQVFNTRLPFRKEKAVVFFDSGSTFSGISNKLAQALKLKVLKTSSFLCTN
ncbi:gag protein [Aphelenchoides avenae]|nr:gag protein [Aphelenchus avenae]